MVSDIDMDVGADMDVAMEADIDTDRNQTRRKQRT